MENREYPDIQFVETDVETIESSMIALYELLMQEYGREDYKMQPASPERVFVAWCAQIVVQQRILIDETAKKNVPRFLMSSWQISSSVRPGFQNRTNTRSFWKQTNA